MKTKTVNQKEREVRTAAREAIHAMAAQEEISRLRTALEKVRFELASNNWVVADRICHDALQRR